jgi:hypothetical protein
MKEIGGALYWEQSHSVLCTALATAMNRFTSEMYPICHTMYSYATSTPCIPRITQINDKWNCICDYLAHVYVCCGDARRRNVSYSDAFL